MKSPTFSRLTPPVGVRRNWGKGPSTSLKYPGPSLVAGKTLTTSAPASQAARISVGVKAPGIHKTLYRLQISITSVFNTRSEEHTSELQSRPHLVCRLLLEKKKQNL